MVGVASVGMTLTGLLTLSLGTGASAATSPGQGSSYAQAFQIAPHEGSLAVGVTVGEALAGHTDTDARAQSLGMDLGAIGTSLKAYNCGQAPNQYEAELVPSPLEAETGGPGAAQGEKVSPSATDYGFTEYALANTVPYAEADTTLAEQLSTPAFAVSGATTKSWSGLVGGQREAGATSDIGLLSIADGLVQLKNLDWESVYPSGGSARPTGSFSIGSAVIDGHPLSSAQLQNFASLQATVNKLLNVIGVEMLFPQTLDSGGVETVTPLEFEVVPNATRDTVVDGILNAGAPVSNPLFTGLESGFGSVPNQPWESIGKAEPASVAQALCQSDTAITVEAVTVASLSGAGYFDADLGGVNSSSSAVATNPFSLQSFGFGKLTIPGTTRFVSGTPGTAGTPAIGGTPAAAVPTGAPVAPAAAAGGRPAVRQPVAGASPSPAGKSSPAAPVRAQPASASALGATGGALLAAGLGGLGLLALLAEGDRRMMRRAQHTVSFEE